MATVPIAGPPARCAACTILAAAEAIVEAVQPAGIPNLDSFPRSALAVRILTLLAGYAPHGLTAATIARTLDMPLQAVVPVTYALHLLGTLHANEKGYYRFVQKETHA